MEQTNTILGLLAQTSLHAGTGQQTGVIDLPIQREGHNGWPCVFGSGVKGALRTRAEQDKLAQLKQDDKLSMNADDYQRKVQESPEISIVFGPPPGVAEIKHAGALIVTDARLLLFPVRSLTSQFKWVTCPAALRRYLADRQRLTGVAPDCVIPEPVDDREQSAAMVPQASSTDALFLEEYRFSVTAQDLSALTGLLAALMAVEGAQALLEKQLVVVSDDSFAHIVNHATPVNAHISIDAQTKVVRSGGLWYEETLPPETLLYVGLSASDARKEKAEMPAAKVLTNVLEMFRAKPWLQIGGNETVGMGWCAVKLLGEGFEMQTIQQKRAQFALTEVLKISNSSASQKQKDEYKAMHRRCRR
ncbi:MAG: type III-B CRISPR module RAMP protein Cmr4 [Thiolinea sp.]